MSDEPKGISNDEMRTLTELCLRSGLKPLVVKSPINFDLCEIEISGNLVILRGWVTAFKKSTEVTRVFRKVS